MRFLASLITVILILGTVGCTQISTSFPETAIRNENTDTDSDETKKIETDAQTEAPEDDEYDNRAFVSGKKIYVNYKDGRRKDEKHTSLVFHNNHSDMVSLVYNKVDAFNGKLDDVFDFLNTGLLFGDLAVYADASFFDSTKSYEISATSKESVSFGDLDTVKIVGSVEDTYGRVCHVYGYTFIIDDVPCFLVGFVFTEEQEQSMIDSINAEVDAMIKTVRTER